LLKDIQWNASLQSTNQVIPGNNMHGKKKKLIIKNNNNNNVLLLMTFKQKILSLITIEIAGCLHKTKATIYKQKLQGKFREKEGNLKMTASTKVKAGVRLLMAEARVAELY
jgi:hypothetical protein